MIAFLFLLHFRYEDLYLDDCLEKWTDPYYMCNDFLIQLVNETAREVVMKAVGEDAYQVFVLFYGYSKDFFSVFNQLFKHVQCREIYFRTHAMRTHVARKILVNQIQVVGLDQHSTVNVPRMEPMEKCARKVTE